MLLVVISILLNHKLPDMKKLTLLFAVMTGLTVITASYKSAETAPRLYSELQAYFNSISKDEYLKSHLSSLEQIKYDISSSTLGYDDWNLVFYCSENTFRSQASQVFAQTLCYARNYRKMKIYSAGLTSGEISTKLIEYLKKIGYRITQSEKEGKSTYEIRYNDKADPIILYSKTMSDKSLPSRDVTSVIVCDIEKETDCATIKTESRAINLPFTKVNVTDQTDKVESTLKSIASEMLYVTSKK